MDSPYLIISDLQIPYEHRNALAFYRYLKRHYKVPANRVYCVGDETDQYWGSLYKKSVQAGHTAVQEIEASIDQLRPWYEEFPEMKLAISNHGVRWMKKALEVEVPSQLMRDYKDVIQAPKGWVWQKQWVVQDYHPFIVEHGDDFAGPTPHLQAANANLYSTAIGHHHTKSGIEYVNGRSGQKWGMVTGCTIDFEAYAFDYARKHLTKPVLSGGLVFNRGTTPVIIPME